MSRVDPRAIGDLIRTGSAAPRRAGPSPHADAHNSTGCSTSCPTRRRCATTARSSCSVPAPRRMCLGHASVKPTSILVQAAGLGREVAAMARRCFFEKVAEAAIEVTREVDPLFKQISKGGRTPEESGGSILDGACPLPDVRRTN
jgi:hypothetical protein